MIVYSSASRLRQAAAIKEAPSAVQVRKRREVGVDKTPMTLNSATGSCARCAVPVRQRRR